MMTVYIVQGFILVCVCLGWGGWGVGEISHPPPPPNVAEKQLLVEMGLSLDPRLPFLRRKRT